MCGGEREAEKGEIEIMRDRRRKREKNGVLIFL